MIAVFKVDIKKLERGMGRRFSLITAQLNIPLSDRGKRNVGGSKKFKKGRGFDNKGPGTAHHKVVPGNGTSIQTRNGIIFKRS
jgi:hypothetical protein